MEELKQNYLDRLNNLHQFLYCELPLKLMNHNEDESCIDLQDRLYNLIETGYIKENEQQIQQLIEENYKLNNKENDKNQVNQSARQIKQLAELQNQKDQLQIQLEDKEQLLFEVQQKMQNFEQLSDNLIKAEELLQQLTNENIQLTQQIELEQNINIQYKQQIEQLQQLVIQKENQQKLYPQLQIIYDQVNSLRIELTGLQAELKIRMQILEQFKTQLTSDLIKGFHTILSKTKQELQQEIIESKKLLHQQNETQNQQINKLKKDIQFYKVLEEEYETKIKEIFIQKSDYEQLIKDKDEQLDNVANKLDLIQQNIELTEQNYQQQIIDLQNKKEQYKLQLNDTKNQLLQIQQRIYLLINYNQQQTKFIEENILQLEQKLKQENQQLIDGLSEELSQSIETIKKQYQNIRTLELQCIKQNFNERNSMKEQKIIEQETQQIKQDNSFILYQRTGRLDEQRKYLDDLKKLHRVTKSQLKLNKKY